MKFFGIVSVLVIVSFVNNSSLSADANSTINQECLRATLGAYTFAVTKLSRTACYLCSKCERESLCPNYTTIRLPVFENILQGGFYFSRYSQKVSVNVMYPNNCILKVWFNLDINGPKLITFVLCKEGAGSPSCTSYKDKALTFVDRGIKFFMFTLRFSPRKVFAMVQVKSTYFEFRNRSNQRDLDVDCELANLTMDYSFYRNSREALGVMVPCSPGGFLVDPETGRLGTEVFLNDITDLSSTADLANITGIDPNKKFPSKIPSTLDSLPTYVDPFGMIITEAATTPTITTRRPTTTTRRPTATTRRPTITTTTTRPTTTTSRTTTPTTSTTTTTTTPPTTTTSTTTSTTTTTTTTSTTSSPSPPSTTTTTTTTTTLPPTTSIKTTITSPSPPPPPPPPTTTITSSPPTLEKTKTFAPLPLTTTTTTTTSTIISSPPTPEKTKTLAPLPLTTITTLTEIVTSRPPKIEIFTTRPTKEEIITMMTEIDTESPMVNEIKEIPRNTDILPIVNDEITTQSLSCRRKPLSLRLRLNEANQSSPSQIRLLVLIAATLFMT